MERIIMKMPLFVSLTMLAGALTAGAQDQKTNSPPVPVKGHAVTQGQVTRPSQFSGAVVREPQYYQAHPSGVLPNLAKGTLLKPPTQPNPRDPAQNPAVDMMTRRPRGVVLWSWDF